MLFIITWNKILTITFGGQGVFWTTFTTPSAWTPSRNATNYHLLLCICTFTGCTAHHPAIIYVLMCKLL